MGDRDEVLHPRRPARRDPQVHRPETRRRLSLFSPQFQIRNPIFKMTSIFESLSLSEISLRDPEGSKYSSQHFVSQLQKTRNSKIQNKKIKTIKNTKKHTYWTWCEILHCLFLIKFNLLNLLD
uniref:Uncharacterized protein n=1 Tax=Cacopsylla melanoneura TaxID=428564 RepID=A0A8D8QBD4_9HEMI